MRAGTTRTNIALVTGAPSGIGEATAERLATAGYKVHGTSRRDSHRGSRSFRVLPLDVGIRKDLQLDSIGTR